MTTNTHSISAQSFEKYLDQYLNTLSSSDGSKVRKNATEFIGQIKSRNLSEMLQAKGLLISNQGNEERMEKLLVDCHQVSIHIRLLLRQLILYETDTNKQIIENFIFAGYKVHLIVQCILEELKSVEKQGHFESYLSILAHGSFGDTTVETVLQNLPKKIKEFCEKNKSFELEQLIEVLDQEGNELISRKMQFIHDKLKNPAQKVLDQSSSSNSSDEDVIEKSEEEQTMFILESSSSSRHSEDGNNSGYESDNSSN